MPVNGLIVLVGVKPGCEMRLRAILNRIGNDVKGKRLANAAPEPHIDFPRSRTIHFARLAMLDDPERGPGRKRLLLVTDYDGKWRDHVVEIASITSDPDAIWGCCTGYAGRDRFPEFIREHTVAPQAYYIAFRDLTLRHIQALLKLREEWTAPPGAVPPSSLTATTTTILNDLARFPSVAVEAPGLLLRRGPLTTLLAARRVNATLDRIWWVWWFNRLTLNSFPSPSIRYSSVSVDTTADCMPATGEDEVTSNVAWEGTPAEDLVSQNQLTLVTVVKPHQLARLQAVLAVINLYARSLAAPGSLVGIATIHTVRWAVIDGGKRLLMVSNYDGTWENYIDEFAELILSGLNAIWETSYGFPQLGAQDLVAFKAFLRCHQVPANIFYSGYPSGTVANIADALQMDLDKRLPQS
jgi:hypothetical protein